LTQRVENAADALRNPANQPTANQASTTASQAADTAAKGVAAAGYGTFLLLMIACGAAILGGYASAPREVRRMV
jgi:hypothetical protein